MAFENVDWDKLIQRINQGTCTPFIGSGACAGYLPLGGDLAEAMAEDDGYPMSQGRRDLARVSQYMAVKHTDGNYPKTEIANFFGFNAPRPEVTNRKGLLDCLYRSRRMPDFAKDDTNPHSILAGLKSAIYLTTNYDDFMGSAIRANAKTQGLKEPKRAFCRWTNQLFEDQRSPFDLGYTPTRDEPVVFHLHGHAGVPDSIVVTEDDYTDFIVNISSELSSSKNGKGKKERLPASIRSAVRNHMLLFVGYRIADQNLRVVLRTLFQALGPADKHLNVAIQFNPETGMADAQTVARIQESLEARYRWSLSLQVYWGDAREFALELRNQIEKRSLSPVSQHDTKIKDNTGAVPGPSAV